MSTTHFHAIPAHSPGNYVAHTKKTKEGMGFGEVKPRPTSPINFASPECILTENDGIDAQQVLAGLAFNNKLQFSTSRADTTMEVLEACGLFQNIGGRAGRRKRKGKSNR